MTPNRWSMRIFSRLLVVVLLLAMTQSAHAHIEAGQASGFLAGLRHPWSGLDHIVAMIAVGIWGAQLGLPAIWLLPVAFPMVMAFGGFLGLIGVPLPKVEVGIALSALLLGGLVCGEVKLKLVIAVVIVGIFGLFHGHAHGTELPQGQSGLLYSIGFVVATGTLHALGIALGLIHRWPAGRLILRWAGAMIALLGCFFLWKAIA